MVHFVIRGMLTHKAMDTNPGNPMNEYATAPLANPADRDPRTACVLYSQENLKKALSCLSYMSPWCVIVNGIEKVKAKSSQLVDSQKTKRTRCVRVPTDQDIADHFANYPQTEETARDMAQCKLASSILARTLLRQPDPIGLESAITAYQRGSALKQHLPTPGNLVKKDRLNALGMSALATGNESTEIRAAWVTFDMHEKMRLEYVHSKLSGKSASDKYLKDYNTSQAQSHNIQVAQGMGVDFSDLIPNEQLVSDLESKHYEGRVIGDSDIYNVRNAVTRPPVDPNAVKEKSKNTQYREMVAMYKSLTNHTLDIKEEIANDTLSYRTWHINGALEEKQKNPLALFVHDVATNSLMLLDHTRTIAQAPQHEVPRLTVQPTKVVEPAKVSEYKAVQNKTLQNAVNQQIANSSQPKFSYSKTQPQDIFGGGRPLGYSAQNPYYAQASQQPVAASHGVLGSAPRAVNVPFAPINSNAPAYKPAPQPQQPPPAFQQTQATQQAPPAFQQNQAAQQSAPAQQNQYAQPEYDDYGDDDGTLNESDLA